MKDGIGNTEILTGSVYNTQTVFRNPLTAIIDLLPALPHGAAQIISHRGRSIYSTCYLTGKEASTQLVTSPSKEHGFSDTRGKREAMTDADDLRLRLKSDATL